MLLPTHYSDNPNVNDKTKECSIIPRCLNKPRLALITSIALVGITLVGVALFVHFQPTSHLSAALGPLGFYGLLTGGGVCLISTLGLSIIFARSCTPKQNNSSSAHPVSFEPPPPPPPLPPPQPPSDGFSPQTSGSEGKDPSSPASNQSSTNLSHGGLAAQLARSQSKLTSVEISEDSSPPKSPPRKVDPIAQAAAAKRGQLKKVGSSKKRTPKMEKPKEEPSELERKFAEKRKVTKRSLPSKPGQGTPPSPDSDRKMIAKTASGEGDGQVQPENSFAISNVDREELRQKCKNLLESGEISHGDLQIYEVFIDSGSDAEIEEIHKKVLAMEADSPSESSHL